MILALFTTACMLIAIASCVIHLNAPPTTRSHCEKIGFAVLATGCAAGIYESWSPAADLLAVPLISTGLALIALSMDREKFRAALSRTIRTHAYKGPDRRTPT